METELTMCNNLIEAVIDNNVPLVNDLLNQGADPNYTQDECMVTPLHFAAQHNALEVIPLLIEAGALIDAETEPDGLTPLEIAMIHGHDKIVQLIVAYYNTGLNTH